MMVDEELKSLRKEIVSLKHKRDRLRWKCYPEEEKAVILEDVRKGIMADDQGLMLGEPLRRVLRHTGPKYRVKKKRNIYVKHKKKQREMVVEDEKKFEIAKKNFDEFMRRFK